MKSLIRDNRGCGFISEGKVSYTLREPVLVTSRDCGSFQQCRVTHKRKAVYETKIYPYGLYLLTANSGHEISQGLIPDKIQKSRFF